MSNILLALILFGILFAIAIIGLSISSRASERQDSSRSDQRPSHPGAWMTDPGTGRFDR
jgi:hypothetical protein